MESRLAKYRMRCWYILSTYRSRYSNVHHVRSKENTIKSNRMPDIDRMTRDLAEQWQHLSSEERADFDKRLDDAYPGGFNERDEANALIAMAVRNGPIEDLHAGKYSALLEDMSLSRITDEEMKVLMLNATRMLAGLLRFRHQNPELYRRWIRTYGTTYCERWERELDR